jgi:hypothetical protein
MIGTTVCRLHGGAAPQVRRRAEQRILEASDKAAYELVKMMQDPKTPAPVKLGAIRDLLDRASLTGKQELDIAVRVSKFDQIERDIVMDIEPLGDGDEFIVDAEVVEDDEAAEAAADEEMTERQRRRDREYSRKTGRRDSGAGGTLHKPPPQLPAAEEPKPTEPQRPEPMEVLTEDEYIQRMALEKLQKEHLRRASGRRGGGRRG